MNRLLSLFAGFCVLLIFWVAGQLLVGLLPIKIPGALMGMSLLLAFLMLLGRIPDFLNEASKPFLQHMALFFVPAVMGVWLYRDILSGFASTFLAIIVVSTLVLMVIVGQIAQKLIGSGSKGQQ